MSLCTRWAGGKLVIYEELTLPLFIPRYLAILEMVKPTQKEAMLKNLHELMVDAELYGWELVGAFLTIWLQ